MLTTVWTIWVLWHVSCHSVIIPQLLSSKDFSYNLIPKPFTLKFVHFVISECLIKLLFPKLLQNAMSILHFSYTTW